MKKIAILIMGMGLISSSCDESYLDQIPQDAFSAGSVYQTEADLSAFLATIYNRQYGHSLTDGWPNRGMDVFSNWSEDGYGRRDCCSGSDLLDFEGGGGKLNNLYNDNYVGIRQINEFLQNAPQAEANFNDPSIYKRMINEARFHRAYYYYKLNSFFGAVPLVLDIPGTFEIRPKNTRLSVFEWIDSELADIANGLPESYSGNNTGRITKWTAMALRGRHLLYAIDWHPDVASLYSRAETVLKDVYENSGYSLVPGADGYNSLFTKAGAITTENLWSKYYGQSEYGGSNSQTGTSTGIPFLSLPPGSAGNNGGTAARGAYGATSRLVEAYQMTNGLDIHDPLSGYDPANPWDNRDPRLDATILRAGEEIPRRGASSIDDTYVLNPHPSIGSISADFATGTNTNRTGYYYQKYRVDFNWLSLNDAKLADVQYHFIRFAEVILMYAEARLGNSGDVAGAMNLVNEVRNRVGMPDASASDADEALDKILFERRIEFASEGDHRYFDIRRHRLGEEVFVGTLPGGGDKSIAYGIPLGDGGSPDAAVNEGDLDDSKKRVVGPKTFNASYYAPAIPGAAITRNPKLAEEPVDFGPWEPFFD